MAVSPIATAKSGRNFNLFLWADEVQGKDCDESCMLRRNQSLCHYGCLGMEQGNFKRHDSNTRMNMVGKTASLAWCVGMLETLSTVSLMIQILQILIVAIVGPKMA